MKPGAVVRWTFIQGDGRVACDRGWAKPPYFTNKFSRCHAKCSGFGPAASVGTVSG
jgi:hypothetical protein